MLTVIALAHIDVRNTCPGLEVQKKLADWPKKLADWPNIEENKEKAYTEYV